MRRAGLRLAAAVGLVLVAAPPAVAAPSPFLGKIAFES
jgi:hypothetical protein